MQTIVRASRRKFHIIYKTTCLVTGKWYIGMHSTDDLNDGYMGSGQQLRRSIAKHGKEQHRTEVLELLPDRESLWKREEELVTKKLMEDELCMNLATGGQGKADRPLVTKESTAAKLSVASKRAVRTDEWKARISASHLGKKQNPEVSKRHSEKLKGRKQRPEDVAKRVQGQLASEKFKRRYRAIVVDGVTYANGREAVAALGLPGSTLHYRVTSPNWVSYRWADQPEKPLTGVAPTARGPYDRT